MNTAGAESEPRGGLGPVAVAARAVVTHGLTRTAVIHITEAMRSSGCASGISDLIALAAVPLVSETLGDSLQGVLADLMVAVGSFIALETPRTWVRQR